MNLGQRIDRTPPTPDEVHAALHRVIDSESFRGSPQLASFLRFVVEASLRGESERIKGYTIGIEALGRGPGFDPQIDPIVRVEATRLRRAIERYYTGPGTNDPLIIELSRGSYVPSFRRRGAADDTPEEPAAPQGTTTRIPLPRTALISIVAVLVVGGLLYAAAGWWNSGPVPPATGALRPGNGMPTIGIQPFDRAGTPRPQAPSTEALQDKIRDAFARFDTFNVEFDPAMDGGPVPRPAQPAIDYRLVGSIEYREDGSTGARFRLLDTADGKVVWSRTFEPFPATMDRAAIEERIVFDLATTLLQPFGVVRSLERVKHLSTDAGDPRNRCIVETSESLRSFEPSSHDRARACLERLTALDPGFSSGFAYLAAVYYREFQYRLGVRSADPPALDRALLAARRAAELKPESSRAYGMLFTVLYARRDLAAAFAAGDKAIALNKYDMTLLSDYGGRLIMNGEIERGMELLRRSAEYGAVRPSWYHFYLFLGNYLRGDLAEASYHAGQSANVDYPLGHLARALAAAAADDRVRAREALDRLVALRPAWDSQTRQELERFFPSAAIVNRLERDLAAAGLSTSR